MSEKEKSMADSVRIKMTKYVYEKGAPGDEARRFVSAGATEVRIYSEAGDEVLGFLAITGERETALRRELQISGATACLGAS